MILMMIVAGMELGIIFTATSNYLKSLFVISMFCGDVKGIKFDETFSIQKFVVLKYFYIEPMGIWRGIFDKVVNLKKLFAITRFD